MSLSICPARPLHAARTLRARPHALALAALALLGSPLLQAQTAAQEPIVVTGTRFREDAGNLPFGVSVISAQDIARAGATTVNEAIIKLLGVPGRQDYYGGGDYALDLRGFGSAAASNQIVVVDGLRINEGDLSGARLAGIPIDTVERIEVLRGSGTVLYGEGGTGGVIVITTRGGRGVGRATQGQVYAGAGSFGTRELRASTTLVQDAFSFDLAGNKRQSDNYRDNFRSDVQGISLGGQWRHDDLRLALRHARDDLDAGLPGALSAADFASNPRHTNSPDNHATLRNSRTTLLGEATLGAWELALDLAMRDKAVRSVSVSSFGTSHYDFDVTASNVAVRARHVGPVAGLRNSLVVGLDGGEWERTVLGSFGSTARQRSLALYARDELTLAGGTRLSAGLRRESVKKTNSDDQGLDRGQTAWELGLVQPLTPDWSVFARIGDSFRLANADEYGYAQRSGDLRPQTSRDTELGARWRVAATRLEVRAYRNTLTDEIGYDPKAFGPFDTTTAFGANVNFDPTRRQGVELDLGHALGKTVQLRAHLAWRDARFLSGAYAGRQVPLTARRTAALGVDWTVADLHRVGANAFYASPSHPDFDNACTMAAYATLDLRYAYQLPSGELSLAVANATDRRYYTQAFRCNAGVTEGIYPEAGRAVTAALRWRF